MRGAELSWFCEGSGTLFLQAGDETVSPLLLELETMEVSKLEAKKWELNPEPEFCPYEVDPGFTISLEISRYTRYFGFIGGVRYFFTGRN